MTVGFAFSVLHQIRIHRFNGRCALALRVLSSARNRRLIIIFIILLFSRSATHTHTHTPVITDFFPRAVETPSIYYAISRPRDGRIILLCLPHRCFKIKNNNNNNNQKKKKKIIK